MFARTLLLVGTLLPLVGRAETVIRIPVVAAVSSIEAGQGPDALTVITSWSSNSTFYNVGAEQASYRYVDFLGGGRVLGDDHYCSPSTTHTVAANIGGNLSSCVATPLGGSGVGFLRIAVSGDLGIHSSISRLKEVCNCASLECTPIPQGRSQLPVFKDVFSPGTVVVVGEIDLGRAHIPATCGAESERYPRRVNVTLLNEGPVSGHFLIRVLPFRSGSEVLFEQTYVVPARDVVQVNRLPLDLESIARIDRVLGPDAGVRVWIEIGADQPFLAYASTVFEEAAPGTMPFEVFAPIAGVQR